MHYVYILYSADHDKYYVGQTPDVDTRLLFHNQLSEKSYTSRYRPWSMVCKIQVSDRGVAMRIERYIKSRKSRQYIEELIREEVVRDGLLSRYEPQG